MTAFIPVVIVLLISVNALYVAAEFSAVSVRRTQVRALAEDGNRLARLMLPTLMNPAALDRYIAACQIGITLSSLVLGAYGQATLPGVISPWLTDLGLGSEAAAQSASAIIVLVFLTSIQVVLGELVPKSLALQFAAQVALLTAVPMRWSLVIFRPLVALLNGSGLAILKLLGASQSGHGHVHSPEEIELLITQSGDGGLLEPEERSRLRRAIRLGERSAHQVMVPRTRMVAIDADLPFEEIERRVTESPYTRMPVYRRSIDNVVGMLHSKDFMMELLDGKAISSIDHLIRPMVMVPDSAPVYRVLTTLRGSGARQAVVVDEFGGVAGLVTLEGALDEVFGEVGDVPAIGPIRLPDGRLRLPGAMPAEDASALIGVEWNGSADTIGGHVVEMLGHLPDVGERVVIDGAEVEVEAVEHHAISAVLVRPVPLRLMADD